jgi:alpha-L-rhamnosidase
MLVSSRRNMKTFSLAPWPILALLSAFLLVCGFVSAGWAQEKPGSREKPYAGKGLRPAHLRCEYRVNPLGIAETNPRLSWIVESGERGQRQTAYRVLVASSPALLKPGKADLWDSGRRNNSETTAIRYEGKTPSSGQECFWQVKVWDAHGKESPWSRSAMWSMGLLTKEDWQAEWIGCDSLRPRGLPDAQFNNARWIWSADATSSPAPEGRRSFLKEILLPTDVESAELLIASDENFTINWNGARVGLSGPTQTNNLRAYGFDLLRYVQPGTNELRIVAANSAGTAAGMIARLSIRTTQGKQLDLATDATWMASEKLTASATNAKAWKPCRELGEHGMAPWGRLQAQGTILPPAVHLRREFAIGKPVKRATLYATGLGWFDLHLNGKRVCDEYFNPGWTDYRRRVYYRTYDVTDQVRRGTNAIGVVLSDGWFSGYIGWHNLRDHYGTQPRFLGQLAIEFRDGSREVIASAKDWKAMTGPVTGADILKGEHYDARRELADWDLPGYDDGNWKPVDVGAEISANLEPHPAPPVIAVEEIKPQQITEPKPGVYVFDMGQNFSGVTRLRVKGEPGRKITLRHAERLNPDGTIYTINLRQADATDIYICKSTGTEVWSPRFTFHGFQYVEVTGLPERPNENILTGIALTSGTAPAGEFHCSNPMVNRLHRNILWTQLMNFIEIPTDCPQRDERLGWTGDAQVYIRTATLNSDVQAFFTKWLIDLEDAQGADGEFPKVAPLVQNLEGGGPAWADAGIICPWTVYEVYGDTRVLERHYKAMQRFIEFQQKRSTTDLLPPEKFHCYGDWLSIQADTPKDLIYTAYFAQSARLLARTAEVLGLLADAAKYDTLADRIKESFNRAYVDAEGRVKGDTQAGYVLALAFRLVDGPMAERAARHLVENIEARGWHLSTGFIGTKDLMLVLAQIGRNDVAYRLLLNDTFPSWGFSIKHGATSIWERWDGWTPENGFQNPGMNSFAHYSFGAVYQWMVENIGGIRNASPSYKEIVIAPVPGGGLTEARVVYDSIRGEIVSDWKQKTGTFELNVRIPANITATVILPAATAEQVIESGKPLSKATGVRWLKSRNGQAELMVGSGNYRFRVTSPTFD